MWNEIIESLHDNGEVLNFSISFQLLWDKITNNKFRMNLIGNIDFTWTLKKPSILQLNNDLTAPHYTWDSSILVYSTEFHLFVNFYGVNLLSLELPQMLSKYILQNLSNLDCTYWCPRVGRSCPLLV